MSSAKEIVEQYKEAMGQGDFAAARKLLHTIWFSRGRLIPLTRPMTISQPVRSWRTSSKELTSRRYSLTVMMYACYTTWSPILRPERHSLSNGIRFGVTRLGHYEPCSMPARLQRCSGAKIWCRDSSERSGSCVTLAIQYR